MSCPASVTDGDMTLTCSLEGPHDTHHDPDSHQDWLLQTWDRLPPYQCTWSRTQYQDGLVYVNNAPRTCAACGGTLKFPAGPILTVGEVGEIAERAMREAGSERY